MITEMMGVVLLLSIMNMEMWQGFVQYLLTMNEIELR